MPAQPLREEAPTFLQSPHVPPSSSLVEGEEGRGEGAGGPHPRPLSRSVGEGRLVNAVSLTAAGSPPRRPHPFLSRSVGEEGGRGEGEGVPLQLTLLLSTGIPRKPHSSGVVVSTLLAGA